MAGKRKSGFCNAPCLFIPRPPVRCNGTSCVIEGAAAGDRHAWNVVAAGLYPHLRRHARVICRNSETAEDIAQDAMLRAVQSLGQLRTKQTLVAWSKRIVLNIHRMAQRRSLFAPSVVVTLDEQELPPAGGADVFQAAVARETAARIRVAIASLPEPLRRTLELRIGLGLTTNETARAMRVSRDVVRTRLLRARRAVAARLACDQSGAIR